MRFHYINLDRATDRREALEANFRAVAPDRELARFPAVAAEEAAATPGQLRPGEKACLLSHRELLATRDPGRPLMVLEDDAAVSRFTAPVLEAALASSEDFDVLFTDMAVLDRNAMVKMAYDRRDHAGRFVAIDLKGLAFAGSTAYAVRGQAREKLSALLAAEQVLDTPYDLLLRRLIHAGELKARCLFPFVTTLADGADASQIHGSAKALADLPLNLFRRLMYVERDMGRCLELARQVDELMCDDDSRVAGAVFAGMASRPYSAANRGGGAS